MSKTQIDYFKENWDPVTGCSKVSAGCNNCWAETLITTRCKHLPRYKKGFKVTMHPDRMDQPTHWLKHRIVGVVFQGDLFHEDLRFDFIAKVFNVMTEANQHVYLLLTKRPARMKQFVLWYRKQVNFSNWYERFDHLWFGVSVEDQQCADQRIPELFKVPVKNRFVSMEPMLGPIDLTKYIFTDDNGNYLFKGIPEAGRTQYRDVLDWVIVGGESGSKARPMHPDWARTIRDQCTEAGVPFFFKQWGEYGTRWINTSTGEPTFKMFDSYLRWQQKDWVNKGDALISLDGVLCKMGSDLKKAKYPVAIMNKVGKKKAGHELDGKEYRQYPKEILSVISPQSAVASNPKPETKNR